MIATARPIIAAMASSVRVSRLAASVSRRAMPSDSRAMSARKRSRVAERSACIVFMRSYMTANCLASSWLSGASLMLPRQGQPLPRSTRPSVHVGAADPVTDIDASELA